jgi:hypothetical protein
LIVGIDVDKHHPHRRAVGRTRRRAEDELRRVAGTQLDGRLVWLFVTQVLRGTVTDDTARTADLETELHVQRRMRGMLDQPLVVGIIEYLIGGDDSIHRE